MKNNDSTILYLSVPAYFAILLTPLGFIPVIGNMIINFIFLFIISWIVNKQIFLKQVLQRTAVSYGVAMASTAVGFSFCFGSETMKPDDFYSLENVQRMAGRYTEEVRLDEIRTFVICGFIVSVILLLVGHFLLTFRKKAQNKQFSTIQRIVFTIVLTVFNAPYLFFISVDYLRSLGYTHFYGAF